MPALRRFLALQTLLLWQGGFVFYAAVVVPAGTDLFGPAGQGGLTRRVTPVLNLLGLACLTVHAWDVLAGRDPRPRRRQMLLVAAAVLLFALWWLHRVLVFALDAPPGFFRFFHVLYLWVSTLHWLIGLALGWLMLAAWRAEDRGA